MKLILSSLILFACFSVTAQSKKTVEELKNVYATHAAWENAGELSYDAATKMIGVKNYRIPVSGDTQLKLNEKNGNVTFRLQNNTAITDVNDPDYRRAWFEIPFLSKEGATDFIKHFNKLVKEQ
jgi:hypothetical protein